jgi:hypothetical protein
MRGVTLFSRRKSVWRIDQVRRQRRLAIQATQLGDRGIEKRSEQRLNETR